ncbi:MAG: BACON domain-containing protein [Odoribacteraceae bacterium]|jgi:hypothetical protein|nr:BACON domain-containing protein [Odoribacteraceae bacterium]
MKHFLLALLVPLITTVLSCDDEADALLISSNTITIDAAGNEQRITVRTDAPIWNVICEDAWPIITRDSLDVIITAASNPTRTPRSARIYIAAGNQFERITVTQEGSLRVFGDPYPDAINPVGIVYKVSDGGQHGAIVSLDQLTATAWGLDTDTHETDFSDGKINTREIIVTHRDDPTFTTTYPAFAWVHEKNKSDLDGEWYIPSFWEVVEMYNLLVGNSAYIIPGGYPPSMQMNLSRPAHNLTERDYFNARIVAHGGTPFNYSASMYWSSSEASVSSAMAISFNNGTDYMHMNINYNKNTTAAFFFRAIRVF